MDLPRAGSIYPPGYLLVLAQSRSGSSRAAGSGRGIIPPVALTSFAWSIPALHRIELYIEPWNVGSTKTAERAGCEREGLLRSHQEIGGRRRDMLLYTTIRESPG
jgi:hypothetical protein